MASIEAPDEVAIRVFDTAKLDTADRIDFVNRQLELVERSFDLQNGPLVALCLFPSETVADLLVWVVHHVVCDAVSLGVLAYDFWCAYDGARVDPVAGGTYLRWLDSVHMLPAPRFLTSGTDGQQFAKEAHQLGARLSEGAVARERLAPAILGAALLRALPSHTTLGAALALEHNGRVRPELGMELPDAVGWFTTHQRAVVQHLGGCTVSELVLTVRDATRPATVDLGQAQLPKVALNFLGEFPKAPSDHPSCLMDSSPVVADVALLFALEVNCWIEERSLRLLVRHSSAHIDSSTAHTVAERFLAELPDAIDAGESLAALELGGEQDLPAGELAEILEALGDA